MPEAFRKMKEMSRMAIRIENDGLDQLGKMLARLANEAQDVAAGALFDGAGVIADALNKGIDGIQTEQFTYAAGGRKRKPSPQEKDIVLNAAKGIAKFDKDGTEVETSVGYRNAGYATLAGKKVPVPKIVNAINSGTSFMTKQPFIRKAATSGKRAAIDAMEKKINEEFEKITGGEEE